MFLENIDDQWHCHSSSLYRWRQPFWWTAAICFHRKSYRALPHSFPSQPYSLPQASLITPSMATFTVSKLIGWWHSGGVNTAISLRYRMKLADYVRKPWKCGEKQSMFHLERPTLLINTRSRCVSQRHFVTRTLLMRLFQFALQNAI